MHKQEGIELYVGHITHAASPEAGRSSSAGLQMTGRKAYIQIRNEQTINLSVSTCCHLHLFPMPLCCLGGEGVAFSGQVSNPTGAALPPQLKVQSVNTKDWECSLRDLSASSKAQAVRIVTPPISHPAEKYCLI